MDEQNQKIALFVTSGGRLGGSQTAPGSQGQVAAVPVRRNRERTLLATPSQSRRQGDEMLQEKKRFLRHL